MAVSGPKQVSLYLSPYTTSQSLSSPDSRACKLPDLPKQARQLGAAGHRAADSIMRVQKAGWLNAQGVRGVKPTP